MNNLRKRRLRIITGVFAGVVILFSTFSSAFANLTADISTRFPLNQRDKYDTDLFTGSATYSYPLKLPKGTNDLTPEVTFSYNSAGVRDLKTYLGIGWQLNMDYVERDVNATPDNSSDDKFKLHFKGNVYDLVYVSGDSRYHTKIESNLNIQKLTGGSNGNGDYWQVISPDGTKYRFGYATQSELICEGKSYTASWNLDQVTDTRDNKIYYTYLENNGISYLSQIKYNNDQTRIVDFDYTANPYERPVYNQGCYAYDLKRLTNIQVKVGTSLVREYDMAFGQTGNTQPVLDSITENGSDRSHRPPTVFYYKPEIQTFNTTAADWISNANLDYLTLDRPDVVLADINGDGLQDIVKTDGNGGPTSWKALLNLGNNTWATSYTYWVNNASIEDARLDRSDVQLIDVTGDNLPDIVMAADSAHWRVWRNTGTSFNTSYESWADLSSHTGAHLGGSSNDTAVLADVTGDGLPDIINSWWNGSQEYRVFKNTGSGWTSTAEVWSFNNIPVGLENAGVRILDVNGDGLADIVRTVYDESDGQSTWYVWKSTGTGFGSQTIWLDDDLYAYFQREDVTVADVNGDTLPDIIKSIDGGTADEWKVLYNRGGSWYSGWQTWIPTSASVDIDVHNTNTKLVDVNGDGMADVVKGYTSGGQGHVTWKVWKNNGISPHLLESIHKPEGGVITFDYIKAAGFDNTGSDSLSDLPFPLWLVDDMTVTNGLSNSQGTSDVTAYSYKDGFYDWQDKEFRGFAEVNTTEPNGSKKKYVFNQDDALKGKLAEVQHRDASNNPYAETEYAWSNSSSNGVYTVNQTQEKQYTYDGTASSPKVVQTDFTYDNYGNVTKKSEQGDTGVSGDERFTYNEYTYNTTDWIVDSVKKTYLNAANDSTKVSESSFYYDGHTGLGDAPTDGDVTKEVKWTDGLFTTDPATINAYDSFGNKTSVTDANGHTTTTEYETTGTYPKSVTNAKSQKTTYEYDLGTGNLFTKVDPNDIVTSYSYDAYGRKTVEYRRAGVNDFPVVNYTYFYDGSAPEAVLITKRKAGSTSTNGDLKVYTFMDGLDRKIQTRSNAEDTSKQVITDTYYDSFGEVAKETVPYLATFSTTYSTPDNTAKYAQTTRDAIGRTTIVTNPKGDDKTIAYDHWKETKIDENGHIKREFKNAYDKIVKVEEVNDANTYTTTYEYDPRDLLKKITDNSSNETTYTYDALGQKTSQTDPDMGEWTYTYDLVGNLTSQTDAKNVTITRDYDELDRLIKIDYPNDTDVEYTYDVDAVGKNKRIGTLASVTDQAGTIKYGYNDYLLKRSEKRTVDGVTAETAYDYDYADRLKIRRNPDGKKVTYTYNAQGEIETVKEYAYNKQGEVASVNTILDNVDYNALGKITSTAFADGLTTNYSYNSDDFRLNNIQTGSIQDLNYTYDSVGNVSTIVDDVASKTAMFAYDDVDRLTSASESAGYNHSFEYNAIGNLTKFIDGGNTIDYAYGEDAGAHALTSSNEVGTTPTTGPTATPLPTPTPDPSDNLVNNNSFEELSSGWATHWTKVSNFFSIDTSSNGNNGTNSLHLVPNSSSAFVFSENINIDPAKSYDWTQYIKAQSGSGEFGYYIDEYDAEGNWISGQWKGLQANSYTGIKKISYTPSSNDVASIGLQYYAVPNSTFNVYIDSVNVSVHVPSTEVNPQEPMISFTFDDGFKDTFSEAAPTLDKYGIKGVAYVPPNCIDDTNDCHDNTDPDEDFMTWQDVIDLQNIYGWEIGSHTSYHQNLSTLDGSELESLIADPLTDFANHGITATNFASPQGDYDSESLAYVAKYYKSHRAFHNKGVNPWPGDPLTLNVLQVQTGSQTATPSAGITVDQVKSAIDSAIDTKSWLILVFHSIKPTPSNDVEDYEYGTADLDAIAAYTKQKQSIGDIQPVTVEEALDIDHTNLLDGTFISGLPTGWATSSANIIHDTANHGSLPGPIESMALNASGSAMFLYTASVSATPNKSYGFKAYVNNSNLTAGELGFFVDEYDAAGNWISGKWLGAVQPTYVAYFTRVYKPTSPSVASFKIQTYMTAPSVGLTYVDNYELYEVSDM